MRHHLEAKPVPHDLEAECAVLGAMLWDESVIPRVRRLVRPDHFFRPEHQTICEAIFTMLDKGDASLGAIKNQLAADGRLAGIGRDQTEQDGITYLQELAQEWGQFPYHLDPDIKTLRDAAALRELVSLSQRMYEGAKTTAIHDAEAFLDKCQQELFALDLRADTGGDIILAGKAVAEAIEHADKVKAGEAPPGLLTGFGMIDRATGGMQPGDLWTLAGRTSVGKTAFALAIAANVAQQGGGVLCVSAEMDKRSLANRILQAHSRIDASRLRCGNIDEIEHKERAAAAAEIDKWRLAFQPRAATVGEIAIRARQLVMQWGKPLDLIVVDYLQLMKHSGGDTRAQQVSGVAWGLKNLAMETGTPVLMLSQLSRQGVSYDTVPSLYTLKESGDIENHSNVVLLLHRPSPEQSDTDGAIIFWARIAKARDGRTTPWPDRGGAGGILLRFKPEITRFEPLTL